MKLGLFLFAVVCAVIWFVRRKRSAVEPAPRNGIDDQLLRLERAIAAREEGKATCPPAIKDQVIALVAEARGFLDEASDWVLRSMDGAARGALELGFRKMGEIDRVFEQERLRQAALGVTDFYSALAEAGPCSLTRLGVGRFELTAPMVGGLLAFADADPEDILIALGCRPTTWC